MRGHAGGGLHREVVQCDVVGWVQLGEEGVLDVRVGCVWSVWNLQELLSDNTGWATGCRQRNSQPWLSPPSETLPAVVQSVAEGLTGAFERGVCVHVCT